MGKNRRYNKNPLAFYRANLEVYEGMGRAKLSRSDSGLYRALKRAGQLELAIPEAEELAVESGGRLGRGESDLSEDEKAEIIEAYPTSDGNAKEAARHLPYHAKTILRYWRGEGFKIKSTHVITPQAQIDEINDLYTTSNGNASEAARHLPYSVGIIIGCWREEGFEIRGRGRTRKQA